MDLLKNFIYAGVGLAATTTDKLKETVDDLVEKGKISDTEGKKIVEDFFKSTGEKKSDFEAKLKKVQEDLAGKFDFKKKRKKDDAAIDALNKRIEELEAKLAKAEKAASAPKATAKKSSAKKPVAKKTTKKASSTKAKAQDSDKKLK